MMKKKTLLITMVLTMVMSTSVFAAGGDNYGEDIFGTTSSQVTTTKASATEKATDKENIKNNVETCAAQNSTENKNYSERKNLLKKAKIVSIKRVNGNKAKIKLKKIDSASGYQLCYSTNKKFKNNKKVSGSKLSYKLNLMKKGKKYYVKARAFSLSNNKKVYGKWSKVKKI